MWKEWSTQLSLNKRSVSRLFPLRAALLARSRNCGQVRANADTPEASTSKTLSNVVRDCAATFNRECALSLAGASVGVRTHPPPAVGALPALPRIEARLHVQVIATLRPRVRVQTFSFSHCRGATVVGGIHGERVGR